MRALRAIGALFIVLGVALASGLAQPAHAAANLQITASVSPNPMVIGDSATYTVTVTNSGSDNADNATVTITLDSNVTIGTLPDGCTASGQVVTCGGTGTTVAAGGTLTYQIPVTVDSSLSDGTNITMRASVSSSSAQTQQTQLISQAQTLTDVEITKTAPATVNADGTITYTLTVTNKGPSDAVNVTVQDPTNGNLTTITSLPTECPASGLTVTCALGTLTAGEAKTFDFIVKVNSGVSDGTVINNCATVYTGTRESDTDNNISCVETTVGTTPDPAADVSIEKTGPATVIAGGTITYTITVTNNGSDDATGLSFTDLVNSNTTVTLLADGCTSSSGTITCQVGTESSGETKTYTITEMVDSSTADGTVLENCATLESTDELTDHTSCAYTTVETEESPSPPSPPSPPAESPTPSVSATPTETATPPASSTPTPTKSPTGTLTPTPSESASPSASATPHKPPAPSHPPTRSPSPRPALAGANSRKHPAAALPTTGAPIGPATAIGAGLVLVGLLLCWFSRPRRSSLPVSSPHG